MNHFAYNILTNHINRSAAKTGRPWAFPTAYLIDRIAFVLRTGCQWSNLPVEGGSWKTVYAWFSKWSKDGIFEHASRDIVQFYIRRRGLSQNLVVDTSFVKNVMGSNCVGKSPVDRGRKATKVSALVDNIGTPLQILFHPGNKNDGKTLEHLLQNASRYICLQGRALFGDKAYDSKPCREIIQRHSMVNRISKKKTQTPKDVNRVRIAVEWTFGWLDKYRHIIMRFDRLICHFKSFHHLAIINLISKRI